MTYRVSNASVNRDFLSSIQERYAQLSQSQKQLSTGLKLNTLSDDPSGAGLVLGFNTQLADIEQYRRNMADAVGYADTADSELDGVTSALQRIRDLTMQAINGTNDADALASIAAEVAQLKEGIRGHANAKFGDDYMFSGTATTTIPYAVGSNSFAGNTSDIVRRIAPGQQITMNENGDNIFGTTTGATLGTMNVFDMIDRLVSDMTSGLDSDRNELRAEGLDALDTSINRVLQARSAYGSISNQLEVTGDRLDTLEARLSEARSNITDIDFAETYTEYQSRNTAYQAALAAGARLMNVSLMDFLR